MLALGHPKDSHLLFTPQHDFFSLEAEALKYFRVDCMHEVRESAGDRPSCKAFSDIFRMRREVSVPCCSVK